MPLVYLSPSTQEFNPYINGGNEEEQMNLIADEIEAYLRLNGIDFLRNTPDMTARSSIQASNDAGVDLHVAIHSNSSPPNISGLLRGTDIYYSPDDPDSRRFAQILEDNFKSIYPDESKVSALETRELGEVTNTFAPSVLIETAYHDNIDDANWIKQNRRRIAREIARSIVEYFGMEFNDN